MSATAAPVAGVVAVAAAPMTLIAGFPEVPRVAGRLELPVMGNARSYRQWATGISTRTKYKAPLSSEWTRKLDRLLLHRIAGPLLFLAVVIGVFQVDGLPVQPVAGRIGRP